MVLYLFSTVPLNVPPKSIKISWEALILLGIFLKLKIHNPEVSGSNPDLATPLKAHIFKDFKFLRYGLF